ncbi:uncharacterized protein LOC127565943 [Drosophila albomicans]|uniref:Uncharacterized protein LOC127565943 n=1 Tax=Drosophila albomicans TaxID=7291 RepID=A0A9C6T7F3_DROAB|nr:uncharacterized protein LOC127565943 [Drosophila albomicans]
MAKIRYHLLRPIKRGQNEYGLGQLHIKCLLAMAIVLLLFVYYKWSTETTINLTIESTINLPIHSIIPPTEISTIQTDAPQEIVLNSSISQYFVYTENCRMPAVNPFTSDVLKIFHKTAYKKCDISKDLITVNYDESKGNYSLHINRANIRCCYKPILRAGDRTQADNLYKLLRCSNFKQDFVVPKHINAIITECRWLRGRTILQQDAFSFVHPKPKATPKPTAKATVAEEEERRPSVLLWGIDSMSRMNFERTMPQMFKYLREENWFELQGYNKMGDNTFPNLMAVLTGFNNTRSQQVCRPKEVGGMDACPMLWKAYKKKGYMTAYAEDWSLYATFNHLLSGFRVPPTDYYARPFILAIDKELKKEYEMGIPYCVGRRHSAEYVYDAAVQFNRVYRNQTTFGMFWTNSFSHNDFALPTSMDARLFEYMRALKQSGTFENSIVVFFSDHGMRFGDLRNLANGFLEERMPVLYIWLPIWFREKYPQFTLGLQRNKNRLTSPYDIYATLRHILELETPQEKLPLPEGCPKCHSVFFEAAASRSCKDVAIDPHWCTCQDYEKIAVDEPTAVQIAKQLVKATNDYLIAQNLTELCETLRLTNIQSVLRDKNLDTAKTEFYLIRYEAEPAECLFEASTTWNNATNRIAVTVPEISRLTAYSQVSECVKDAIAKKFCICSN